MLASRFHLDTPDHSSRKLRFIVDARQEAVPRCRQRQRRENGSSRKRLSFASDNGLLPALCPDDCPPRTGLQAGIDVNHGDELLIMNRRLLALAGCAFNRNKCNRSPWPKTPAQRGGGHGKVHQGRSIPIPYPDQLLRQQGPRTAVYKACMDGLPASNPSFSDSDRQPLVSNFFRLG